MVEPQPRQLRLSVTTTEQQQPQLAVALMDTDIVQLSGFLQLEGSAVTVSLEGAEAVSLKLATENLAVADAFNFLGLTVFILWAGSEWFVGLCLFVGFVLFSFGERIHLDCSICVMALFLTLTNMPFG